MTAPWLADQPPYTPAPSQEQDAITRIAEARNDNERSNPCG